MGLCVQPDLVLSSGSSVFSEEGSVVGSAVGSEVGSAVGSEVGSEVTSSGGSPRTANPDPIVLPSVMIVVSIDSISASHVLSWVLLLLLSHNSAASPEMCGVAAEVPLKPGSYSFSTKGP